MRAFAEGIHPGPRNCPSGCAIIPTGGHGHNFPGCLEADGPDRIRKAVRLQLRNGAGAIKLIITGGIGTPGEEVNTPQFAAEEIAAGVEIAHWAGNKVAVHAGESASIAIAVRAGVDSVEHGYQIDRATADLMAERGTFLVPTLIVTRDPDLVGDPTRPAWWQDKVKRANEEHLRSFQRCRAAGVKVALGTDLVPIADTTLGEFEQMVKAGMTEMETIVAATRTAAELCRAADTLGTVEEGKVADLIALEANPLENISNLRRLRLVIKAGRIAVLRA